LILAIEYYFAKEGDFAGMLKRTTGVNARVWAGLNEWLGSHADSAERSTDDASALARRLNQNRSLWALRGRREWGLTDASAGDFTGAVLCLPRRREKKNEERKKKDETWYGEVGESHT